MAVVEKLKKYLKYFCLDLDSNSNQLNHLGREVSILLVTGLFQMKQTPSPCDADEDVFGTVTCLQLSNWPYGYLLNMKLSTAMCPSSLLPPLMLQHMT